MKNAKILLLNRDNLKLSSMAWINQNVLSKYQGSGFSSLLNSKEHGGVTHIISIFIRVEPWLKVLYKPVVTGTEHPLTLLGKPDRSDKNPVPQG